MFRTDGFAGIRHPWGIDHACPTFGRSCVYAIDAVQTLTRLTTLRLRLVIGSTEPRHRRFNGGVCLRFSFDGDVMLRFCHVLRKLPFLSTLEGAPLGFGKQPGIEMSCPACPDPVLRLQYLKQCAHSLRRLILYYTDVTVRTEHRA